MGARARRASGRRARERPQPAARHRRRGTCADAVLERRGEGGSLLREPGPAARAADSPHAGRGAARRRALVRRRCQRPPDDGGRWHRPLGREGPAVLAPGLQGALAARPGARRERRGLAARLRGARALLRRGRAPARRPGRPRRDALPHAPPGAAAARVRHAAEPAHVRRRAAGGRGARPRPLPLCVPDGRQLAEAPRAVGVQLVRLLLRLRVPHPGAGRGSGVVPARRGPARRRAADPLLRAPDRGGAGRPARARCRVRGRARPAPARACGRRGARGVGDRDGPPAPDVAQRGPSGRARESLGPRWAEPHVPLLHARGGRLRGARPRVARAVDHVHAGRLRRSGDGRRRPALRAAVHEGWDL